MTPYEVEGLFIEKLTQKYKLNERDIKRAFSQYDKDGMSLYCPLMHYSNSLCSGNGLLNLDELVGAFEKYLNGIDRRSIQDLISRYDVNGDGQISFEEFYELLVRRDASKAPHPRSDPRYKKPTRREEQEEVLYTRPQHARRGAPPVQARPSHRERESYAETNSVNSRDILDRRRGGRDPYTMTEPVDVDRHHRNRGGGGRNDGRRGGRNADYEDPRYDRRHYDECEPDSVSADVYSTDSASARQEEPPPMFGHTRRPYHSSTDDYSEVSNVSDMSDAQSEISDTRSDYSDFRSELSSQFDPEDATDMESRVKVFMHNLKAYLLREALTLRKEEKVANRILVHANELSENVGRTILLRAFGRVSRSVEGERINFRSFYK